MMRRPVSQLSALFLFLRSHKGEVEALISQPDFILIIIQRPQL